ncbi:hypothetical protein [Pseudoxanthomonas winnipegensis]|uniref:hypothetical protein n=1 Tax=Pseudoxanthomonas winnipegensis TaxID=2480810 RepID=UPI0030F4A637
MNWRALACAAALLAVPAMPAIAQQAAPPSTPAYDPETGDAWIDARLRDLGAYAPRYPDAFVDEIARYLDAPRAYVVALGQQPNWAPGDVYYACALAKALAQPCRTVVRARTQDDSDGWQGVAQRLTGKGKPIPYRSVRTLLRTSYAHWARPLD